MLGLLPTVPEFLGGAPRSPRLGISVDTTGTCPHTETHTKCVNGQTVSEQCTAYRDCKTGALIGTDCWNDEVCSSPSGGSGGGGGGTGATGGVATPTTAAGWTKCADEKYTCDWPGAAADLADVRYGAGSKWAEKDSVADKIGCNNSVFGDPNPGQYKACWYKLVGSPVSTPVPPVVTNIPAPGQQTLPNQPTAPPQPVQQCDAPQNVTLDPTERWIEVDPVQCLWQIVRNYSGTQEVLPNVYGGQASIVVPQSAGPAQTPISPGAVGIYQPSYQLPPGSSGLEVSSAEILQGFIDVFGVGPTPDQLTAAEGQHFTNVADLYTYLHGLQTDGSVSTGGGVSLPGAPSFVTDHPYLTLALAGGALWFLFGRGGRR